MTMMMYIGVHWLSHFPLNEWRSFLLSTKMLRVTHCSIDPSYQDRTPVNEDEEALKSLDNLMKYYHGAGCDVVSFRKSIDPMMYCLPLKLSRDKQRFCYCTTE